MKPKPAPKISDHVMFSKKIWLFYHFLKNCDDGPATNSAVFRKENRLRALKMNQIPAVCMHSYSRGCLNIYRCKKKIKIKKFKTADSILKTWKGNDGVMYRSSVKWGKFSDAINLRMVQAPHDFRLRPSALWGAEKNPFGGVIKKEIPIYLRLCLESTTWKI